MDKPQKMDWTFRLLGKPEIWHHEQPIEGFNTQKTQALLFYLIAEGVQQNRNALACFFWDDFNLITSQNNLRTALYHLKQHFDPCLKIERQTVCFSLPDSAYLDLALIENLNPDANKHALATAAAAYRGDFLEGFTTNSPQFEAWKAERQAHYQQLIIGHLLRLAELYQQDQQFQQGLDTAQRILAIDPINEAAILLKMRLLQESGRPEQAIQAYHDYQARLKTHTQAEPAPILTDFYNRLQVQPTSPIRTALPASPTPFFGRKAETRQLSQYLTDPAVRWINLAGPSGVGKSRLALQAAESVSTQFEDGAHYIDLQGLDAAEVEVSIENASKLMLYAMQIKLSLGESYKAQLFGALAQREMVLILDNLEPYEWRLNFYSEMLQSIPRIKLLGISRQPVDLPDGVSMTLKGLPYPRSQAMPEKFTPQLFKRYPSMQLFEDRAQLVNAGFMINEANYRQIAHICRVVGGLPLGIEFFANLLKYLPLAKVSAAVTGDTAQISNLIAQADIPDKLNKIMAFAWKNHASNIQEYALACTLFEGSFSQEAFTAVCEQPIETLETLQDAAILVSNEPARFSIHNLLRIFLDKKQPQPQEEYTARYIQYYLGWLTRLVEQSDFIPYPIEAFRTEYANLVKAWWLALERGSFELLAQACGPLSVVFEQLGLIEAGLKHLDRTASTLENLPGKTNHQALALATVWLETGRLAEKSSQMAAAWQAVEKAQPVALALENDALLAGIMQCKAALSIQSGQLTTAAQLAYEGLTLAVKSAQARLIASGVIGLAEAHCQNHQYQKARKVLKAAFDEHLVKDNSRQMQALLIKLSICEKKQGNFALSMGVSQKAHILNQTLQDNTAEAMLAFIRAENFKFLGQIDTATQAYLQALPVFAGNHLAEWHLRTLANLGLLSAWQGALAAALEQLDMAETLAATHLTRPLPLILAIKIRTLLAAEQIEPAQACLNTARSISGDHACLYLTTAHIELALAEGDHNNAYQLGLSALPQLKTLYFDGIDDPFSVYLSLYQALKADAPDSAAYVLSYASRELARITHNLQTAQAKQAIVNLPHRKELYRIIRSENI